MSDKKEPEERNNNNMNPYRQLTDLLREMRRTILPSVEQTRETYKAALDSINIMAGSVTSLYSPDIFSNELGSIVSEMSQILKTCLDDSITASHNVLESMVELITDIQKEQMQRFKEIDFAAIFSSMYDSIEDCSPLNLRDAVEAAYEVFQNGEENSLEDDTDFLNAEEVKEAIEEQINNPKGFQQRIKEWSEKKIIKYFIIWELICFLYSNFFQPYFQQNVGLPVMTWVVSNVKECPKKGAEVICQIKEGIEAVIIENTNYYYKVSFTDENGAQREGYVAKRNLKLIQENTEDIKGNEEMEKDGVEEPE